LPGLALWAGGPVLLLLRLAPGLPSPGLGPVCRFAVGAN
jgi:hypothetical protein